jgi:hypothetical protein
VPAVRRRARRRAQSIFVCTVETCFVVFVASAALLRPVVMTSPSPGPEVPKTNQNELRRVVRSGGDGPKGVLQFPAGWSRFLSHPMLWQPSPSFSSTSFVSCLFRSWCISSCISGVQGLCLSPAEKVWASLPPFPTWLPEEGGRVGPRGGLPRKGLSRKGTPPEACVKEPCLEEACLEKPCFEKPCLEKACFVEAHLGEAPSGQDSLRQGS